MELGSSLADSLKTVTPQCAMSHNTPLESRNLQSIDSASMASRPLPRSPARQNVAQRWLNSATPAPVASKPVSSPVKRWPPPKVEDLGYAPVLAVPAAAVPESAVEKKAIVSAFQSARAVFEAKKSSSASPPPPLTRRRLTFPAPPPPPVVKQHSAASDLSSSSCSTVDSESDRKLEDNVEVKHELKPSSPVHVLVKKMEMETVVAPRSQRITVKSAPHTAKLASPPPAQVVQAPLSAVVASTSQQMPQGQPSHNEIDPFRLLLPVEAIPTLPDEIIYVYDSAAIDMEKNIKKVVRKLLKKDKVKLEEFKVNSRLFGTDFMDAHAYLDTLIKDFGPIRALQLVPCLLSVQPNMVKGNALFLTAKNYVLRNKHTLEHEFKSLQAENVATTAASSSTTPAGNVVTTSIRTAEATASLVGTPTKASSVVTPKATRQIYNVVKPTTGGAPQNAVGGPALRNIDTAESNGSSALVQPPAPEVAASVGVLVEKQPTDIFTDEAVKEFKPVEPVPEPQVVTPTGTPPPLIYIAVSSSSQTPASAPTARDFVPTPFVTKRAEFVTPSDNGEEFRAESLFGETFKPSPKKKQQQPQQKNIHLDAAAAPTSPASSVHSFDEAESLFGERLSSSSRTSTARRKTVTWGETQTVEVSVEKASPVKTVKKPAPLLFGLATAAAFDSDSDDSDFDD